MESIPTSHKSWKASGKNWEDLLSLEGAFKPKTLFKKAVFEFYQTPFYQQKIHHNFKSKIAFTQTKISINRHSNSSLQNHKRKSKRLLKLLQFTAETYLL